MCDRAHDGANLDLVYESSPQTAAQHVPPTTTHAIFTTCSDSVLLDRPTCDNSGPRAQDLHPCLAVGWTSPPMELNVHVRITEVVLRSPSSHDTRMHHGKALVRKASLSKREGERERKSERGRERDKESIVTPAFSKESMRKIERRLCQRFFCQDQRCSLGSLARRPQYAKRLGVMSPDEASAQASKKGNGSDALCIMGRGAASSSFSEPPEIQLDG